MTLERLFPFCFFWMVIARPVCNDAKILNLHLMLLVFSFSLQFSHKSVVPSSVFAAACSHIATFSHVEVVLFLFSMFKLLHVIELTTTFVKINCTLHALIYFF